MVSAFYAFCRSDVLQSSVHWTTRRRSRRKKKKEEEVEETEEEEKEEVGWMVF